MRAELATSRSTGWRTRRSPRRASTNQTHPVRRRSDHCVDLQSQKQPIQGIPTAQGGLMSNDKTGSTANASQALQPTETNPLDFVPDQIPFDTPYGPPISLDRAQAVIHAAVTEEKKRNW